MRRTRRFRLRSLLPGTVLLLALLSACSLGGQVCPAIAYTYGGPAVVDFVDPLPPGAEVRACFETGCTPHPVARPASGDWSVQQIDPWRTFESMPGGTVLRVVVLDGDRVLHDAEHEIPISAAQERFGGCPGPYEYEPAVVAS